jgi:hypothetical protein
LDELDEQSAAVTNCNRPPSLPPNFRFESLADISTTRSQIIDFFMRKNLANASEGRNFIETVWGRGTMLREPHEVQERIPA